MTSFGEKSDLELVDAALAGDEEAALLLRSDERTSHLERILVGRGATASEAQDVVADVWADCFGSKGGTPLLEKFNGKGAVEAFLTRVSVNRLIDFKRRQRFQADVVRSGAEGGSDGGDEMDRFSADEAGGGALDESEDALVELLRSALSQAFARCDPGSVLILQLVGVHGVNQQAVAMALGWSQSKVSRSMAALMTRLREETLAEIHRVDPWLDLHWEDLVALCQSSSDFFGLGEAG